MNKSAAIMLSAYNGEKYLREQLDSLLRQENVAVEIFVRDDGSSDSTRNILSEYESNNGNFHVDYAQNAGVGNSFMRLLYFVPASFDYYAFADQDDIWESDKILKAVELLEKSGASLYASNQECVDKSGVSLGLRYDTSCYINLLPDEIIGKNMLAGCTMVFPHSFFEILREESRRPSESLLRNRIHDVWVAAVASLHSGIVYDERSFIKYRQHENNVVGASEGGIRKKLKNRMKKVRNKELRNGRSLLAKELIEKFPEAVEKYPLVKVCANSKTLAGKKQILKHGKRLRASTGESGFAFFIKVMSGLF